MSQVDSINASVKDAKKAVPKAWSKLRGPNDAIETCMVHHGEIDDDQPTFASRLR